MTRGGQNGDTENELHHSPIKHFVDVSRENSKLLPSRAVKRFFLDWIHLRAWWIQCDTSSAASNWDWAKGYQLFAVSKWVNSQTKNKEYILFCYWGVNKIKVYHRVKNSTDWYKKWRHPARLHWILNISTIPSSPAVVKPEAPENTELSLPFWNKSVCTSKRDYNNKKYSDYIRGNCFENNGKYYYYICDKWSNACGGNGTTQDDGVSTDVYNWNPYSNLFTPKLLVKLKKVTLKFETLDVVKLKQVLLKLDKLWIKYKSSKVVSNIVWYLKFETNRIIESKTKNNDVDDFFCELSWTCNEEQKDTVSFVTPKWPGWGQSTWEHTIDFKNMSALRISIKRNNQNLTNKLLTKTFTLNYSKLAVNKCSGYQLFAWWKTLSWNREFKTYIKFCKRSNNQIAIYHRVEWEDNNWDFKKDAVKQWTIKLRAWSKPTKMWGFEKLDNMQNSRGANSNNLKSCSIDWANSEILNKYWCATDGNTNIIFRKSDKACLKGEIKNNGIVWTWIANNSSYNFSFGSSNGKMKCINGFFYIRPWDSSKQKYFYYGCNASKQWEQGDPLTTWWQIKACPIGNITLWKTCNLNWYYLGKCKTTTKAKLPEKVKWVCGYLNWTTITSLPKAWTKGLCSVWTIYTPWYYDYKVHWRCSDIWGDNYASCWATPDKIINGKCWDINGKSVSSKPSYNLCKNGTLSRFQYIGYNKYKKGHEFAWKCMGSAFWRQTHWCRAYSDKK